MQTKTALAVAIAIATSVPKGPIFPEVATVRMVKKIKAKNTANSILMEAG
jgi:hypothetical protein